MSWIKERWNQIDSEPKKVLQFGWILSLLLFVIGVIAYFRGHRHCWIEWELSAIVAVLTFFKKSALFYVYRAWMLVAGAISWVLLRVILGILYYLMISPVAVVMRLSGKDVLDQKIDRNRATYWKKRNRTVAKEQYERLY